MRRNLTAVVVAAVMAGLLLAGCVSAEPTRGLEVEAVGRLVQTNDGLRLCPLPGGVDCPGIAVAGHVGDPTDSAAVRLRGRIESNGLVLASGPSAVAAAPAPSLPPVAGRSCRTGTATSTDAAALEALVESAPSYSGRWWDASVNALVVAFAGGSAARLEQLVATIGGTVCVVDATFTLTELRAAAGGLEQASLAWMQDGYVIGGVGLDVASNRVVLRVGAVDPALRSEVERRFGAAVELQWFLRVVQGSVTELSTAAVDPVGLAAPAGGLAGALTYHCRLGRSPTDAPPLNPG